MRRVSTPSSHVAVIGAGVSALVLALADAGYRHISAVDISAAALEQLQQTVAATTGVAPGSVMYICSDVRTVRFDAPVDVWHDRATFHFLTDEADRRMYGDRLGEAVPIGGSALIATFALDGPEQCSGLPVQRYSVSGLHAEFADRFDLVDSWGAEHVTPWGATQSFTHVLLRRADRG